MIQNEIIKEAIELFDAPEKWGAFLELYNKKEDIKKAWYIKLKNAIIEYFNNDIVEGWDYCFWGDNNYVWDFKWFLTKYGQSSLCIGSGWNGEFHLIVQGEQFDKEKITELLKSSKYSKLMSIVRNDRQFEDETKAMEYRNYIFNTAEDGKFEVDTLAWFAGNKTEEFVKQIADKVNSVRKDVEITNLLDEINSITKK